MAEGMAEHSCSPHGAQESERKGCSQERRQTLLGHTHSEPTSDQTLSPNSKSDISPLLHNHISEILLMSVWSFERHFRSKS